MHGDAKVPVFASNTSGGGGGGAGLGGGFGGGGGGIVELTAGGTIMIGDVTANGGNGQDSGASSGAGGGGSGGTILVRAGGTLTGSGMLTVAKGLKGAAGTLGNAGGDGAVGRTRVDAANPSSTGVPIAGYRGPMFANDVAATTLVQTPMVALYGTAFDNADGRVINRAGTATAFAVSFGTGTPATAMPTLPLTAGYNLVCATVTGGSPLNPESTNCIEMAFLPGGM
jgi:hypothetical protein